MNGLSRDGSMNTVDGAYNMNPANGINLFVTPGIDMIAEVRVLTSNYSAKYGSAAGANVVVASKSGGRDLHGSAYDFLRNDKLDARNFFAPSRAALKQNIFGFSIGGPVSLLGYNKSRTKTFFFVSEEWRRARTGQTILGATPATAMRSGDFQAEAARIGKPILDPTTGQPFPNNRIPASRLNSNATLLLQNLFPAPNRSTTDFLNYINVGSVKADMRQDNVRVDHNFSDKVRLMGRFTSDHPNNVYPATSFGGGQVFDTIPQVLNTHAQNATLRLTTSLTPAILNEFSVTSGFTVVDIYPLGGYQTPAGLTIRRPYSADVLNRAPDLTFSGGWSGSGAGTYHPHAGDRALVFADDLSLNVGSHLLQTGFIFNKHGKRQNVVTNVQGSYSFDGRFTNDPVADFLLGSSASFAQASFQRRAYLGYDEWELYFQDDWRVTKKLTLNLGLRWSWNPLATWDGNAMTNFAPDKYSSTKAPNILTTGELVPTPGYDPLNGLVFAGANGIPANFANSPKNLFGPRLGFAYDPQGDGKLAIRGGFGVNYTEANNDAIYNLGTNPPYVQNISFFNAPLDDPAGGATAPLRALGVTMVDPVYQPTLVYSYSFAVQKQLPWELLLETSYVGNQARHVFRNRALNQPLPVAGFDFDPRLSDSTISTDAVRPYLGFAGISIREAAGNSNYNSLQISAARRFAHALDFRVAYTFAKAMGNVAATSSFRTYGAGLQNPYRGDLEYGREEYDRRQALSVSYNYDLPFLAKRTGLVGALLGGWRISGLTSYTSGLPLSPGLSLAGVGLATRPDATGQPNAGPHTISRWFNVNALAKPVRGMYGNSGRTVLVGPGFGIWDFAVSKDFRITERARVQFRSEFFNLFNHTNPYGVSTALGAGNFGSITSARDPRIGELALRLAF